MKMKTSVKAGGRSFGTNHNENQVRGFKIKTSVKASGKINHNENENQIRIG